MNNCFLFILTSSLLCMTTNNNVANIKLNILNEDKDIINGCYICIIPYNSGNRKKIIKLCNGSITIKNLPKNIYKIIIYKANYKTKTIIVNIYKDLNINIYLCTYKNNRLYGYITNHVDENIDDAIVVLYRVIGNHCYFPIDFTYTDFTGEYNFFDIPKGLYIIKAIK